MARRRGKIPLPAARTDTTSGEDGGAASTMVKLTLLGRGSPYILLLTGFSSASLSC